MLPETIFFRFQLPNATTWFYFSMLLAVALFWKFSRLLSVRNLDVIALFILVPGLLLLQEARGVQSVHSGIVTTPLPNAHLRDLGYLWLLCGSGFFLVRCLFDLALVRRPALAPNLSLGGLACLACALFAALASVAVRPPENPSVPEPLVGKRSVGVEQMETQLEKAAGNVGGAEARSWVPTGIAIACHVAVVAGLILVGYRHFQDLHAGMAAATFYLLLPYTALNVRDWHHVLPIAFLIWAVVFYRRATVAGIFLGLAAGSMYFPALVFPVWASFYRRRGAGRFALAFALALAISLAAVGGVLYWQGTLKAELNSVWSLSDWQAWKAPTSESFWLGVHWAYRLPVFIAYIAFVIGSAFWPAPKNLAHVLALSAAVLIGIQFWYADRGGEYVLWYLPLLLLLVFRPNLADRRPPPIILEKDWLTNTRHRLARVAARLVHFPEPTAHVH